MSHLMRLVALMALLPNIAGLVLAFGLCQQFGLLRASKEPAVAFHGGFIFDDLQCLP